VILLSQEAFFWGTSRFWDWVKIPVNVKHSFAVSLKLFHFLDDTDTAEVLNVFCQMFVDYQLKPAIAPPQTSMTRFWL